MRKKLYLLLSSMMMISALAGCAQKEPEVTVIPYDPYSFTPREFVEDGAWDIAKESVQNYLPKLFCEASGIVVDGENYEDVLSTTGQNYDFENSTLECAIYAKPGSEEDVEKNWIDILYTIPYVDENELERTALFRAHVANITKTEDGVYTAVEFSSDTSGYLYNNVGRKDIDNNSLYIVNDDAVKEILDYGILECNEEGDVAKLAEYAREKEEDRLATYLMAQQQRSSMFFTTGTYVACSPDNYTKDYNQALIIQDMTEFASNYGLKTVDYSTLPEKEKDAKKAGWEFGDITCVSTDDGLKVQQYLQNQIRAIYMNDNQAVLTFNATQLETDKGEPYITIRIGVHAAMIEEEITK